MEMPVRTRVNDGESIEQLVQQALNDEGINVASPEGREIASSILRHASLHVGMVKTTENTSARTWVRNRMAKDIVETAEWIGLIVDEFGYIWIPPHWQRPSDSILSQFRLPRLAHLLANGYANRTMRRRSTYAHR